MVLPRIRGIDKSYWPENNTLNPFAHSIMHLSVNHVFQHSPIGSHSIRIYHTQHRANVDRARLLFTIIINQYTVRHCNAESGHPSSCFREPIFPLLTTILQDSSSFAQRTTPERIFQSPLKNRLSIEIRAIKLRKYL